MLRKAIISLMGATMLLTGCNSTTEIPETTMPEVEHQTYIMSGRYYTKGELFTEDGNAWNYSQDVISEKPSYDNEPVFALMDNMGTANKFDDEVIGLVLDMETEIYDKLEIVLSEDFNVEREGNNLHLSMDPEQ